MRPRLLSSFVLMTLAACDEYVVDDMLYACGNARVDGDEQCDPGVDVPGDGCRADCTLAVLEVAADGNHTCVIVGDGRVRCWGAFDYGQIGPAGPKQDLPIDERAKKIVAGARHTCVLTEGEHVYCWGAGKEGQLGDGAPVKNATPVRVELEHVSQVSAGGNHTCAIQGDSLWCWGANDDGQIGVDSGTQAVVSPARVDQLPGEVTQVAAGRWHTCATNSDGLLFCWGGAMHATFGVGSTEARVGPKRVGSTSWNIDSVYAGAHHTCVLFSDSPEIRCWGSNGFFQLGDRETNVLDAMNARAIDSHGATRLAAGYDHNYLLYDSAVRCWGRGDYGQLGNGSTDHNEPLPTADVNVAGRVRKVDAGGHHTCAILDDESLRCWGKGTRGQLGYEDAQDEASPATLDEVPLD
jgi:cysteine-rich repeat protein